MITGKSNFQKLLFSIAFIASCFTMNSDNLTGYMQSQGTMFIFFRLTLIFVFVFIITLINKNNTEFISKFVPIAVTIITVLLIFDYYVTNISGSQFLFRVWWIASIYVAMAAVFIALSISKCDKYALFYQNFWYGFTPIYLFTVIICFLRNPFSGTRTVNKTIFHGTFLMLKAFIKNPSGSFEAPLIFFGNVLIFIPLSFILLTIFKKAKNGYIAAIGIFVPIIVEGYQYIFSCGDVDVDDLILNWFGFFAGFAVQRIISKKLLK